MNALRRAGSHDEGPAWGAWIKLAGVESTEVLARAGFDFCVVDLEHTLLDLGQVQAHLVAGAALGMRMLVRVPDHRPSTVQRVLDGGAHGVVVPHVDDAATAASLVAAATFPPRGVRGSGGTSRAGAFGARPRGEYLESAGLVIAQIESVDAVRRLADISRVQGLTALLLGAADLGLDPERATLGTPQDVEDAVVRQSHAVGLLAGTACAPGQAQAQAVAGFDAIVCASDVGMLTTAAHEAMRMARSGLRTSSQD